MVVLVEMVVMVEMVEMVEMVKCLKWWNGKIVKMGKWLK